MTRSRPSLTSLRTSAAALAIAFGTPLALHATDRSWIDPAGGFFSDTANWSGSVIPGSLDRAIFNQSSSYTVSFVTNPSNAQLRIGNDAVIFNLGGHTYHLTSTSSGSLSIGGAVPVHSQPAQVGHLTLTGGTLDSVDTNIGESSAGSGSITVSTGAIWNNSAQLNIGMGTAGTLSVLNGGTATTLFGTIGYDTIGTATVSGSGSTWNVTSHLDVGGNTTGTLNVQSAGHLSTSSASIAPISGTSATATLVGANSHWDQTSYFRVGELGAGTLNIQSGAYVSNTSATQDSSVGDQVGGNGTANVNAGSWTIANRSLSVGNLGAGALNITNGGLVSLNNSDINIALGGFSTSSVGVTGTNSKLNAKSLYVGGSVSGQGSTGVLTVGAGGQVSIGFNNVLKLWPTGTVHLQPGGTISTGLLAIQSGGTFDWTGGTFDLNNMDLDIGPSGPLGSNLTVGTGKVLDVGLGLHAGSGGNGSFTVSGGGLVYTYNATAGYSAGPTGSALIDGAGSLWVCYHAFTVGGAGTGTLTVSNGGDLESLGADLTEPDAIIGDQPGKTGTATVTGLGSMWHAYGIPTTPTIFVVGNSGTGTLHIADGGVVAHEASDAIVANNAGSHGAVTVTGAGSRWTTDIYNLVIGSSGTATLDISAGGLVENPFGLTMLGQYTGSSGTATLDGANSRWSGFQVIVGGDGAGHLSITNGGAFSGSEIYVASGASPASDITVDGPGSSIVATTGSGYLIPGSAGNGSLTVQNGGLAHCTEAIIGDGNTATGTLTLTGAGSQLIADDEIDVGFFGTGRLEIHTGCTASTPGAAHVNSTSTLDLAGGSLTAATLNLAGGALIGEGTVSAIVTNTGHVAPGHSAGLLSISGTYAQAPTGALDMELGGLTPGTDHDQLNVSGAAALDGTLHISLIGGFRPSLGQTFTILTAGSVSGTFANVVTSPPTLGVNVIYNPQSVVVQIARTPASLGDFDADGDADQDDFTAFKACFSGPGVPYANGCAQADFDNDSDVDDADFGILQRCLAGPGVLPACMP